MIAINAIYVTYQGEQNTQGIGAPVIFVRTQGCHLRCYKDTLGVLCDTPEALEKDESKGMSIDHILDVCKDIRSKTGVKLICLSGGDPLYGKQSDIIELLENFSKNGFSTSIETSGTLPIRPYINIPDVHFVLDWKGPSTGIKQGFHPDNIDVLNMKRHWNYYENYGMILKFVIYNLFDYTNMLQDVFLISNPSVKYCAGVYWGSPEMTNTQLFDLMKGDALLGKFTLNVQLHKLVTYYDLSDMAKVSQTEIPKKI